MIDLKDLRENPERYRQGAQHKGGDPVIVDQLLEIDQVLRKLTSEREQLTAEKNRLGKEIGALAVQLKKADEATRSRLQQQMQALQQRPAQIKQRENDLTGDINQLQPRHQALWLQVPQPPDADVPVGLSPEDNVPLRAWSPPWFDPAKTFEQNKGFSPKSHTELGEGLGILDFERGVKVAGSRSYVLRGDGMRLHQAILRCAFDYMTVEHGFTALSVPVLVREEMMVGTGFFPAGKDQAYEIANPTSDAEAGYKLYLTGTGEVGLMAHHGEEILDFEQLPLRYTTVSTCFRREAGAAGKDTAGLFRIHQFDKVEQVVICRADEAESRGWHQKMIGYVEMLLQRLELPYRLLQCCTADLGPKNADQIDIECWMPSRGQGGAYGETHSASRLYDYQCRRLNLRYRDPQTRKTVVCHALNNTVAASPRILIPIMELYQNADGSITIPALLRPYMNNQEKIG